MKSFISLVLLSLFVVSTSGFQIFKHYCGGYLAEVSVYLPSNPCLDENGEESCHKEMGKSCCDDEMQFFSLDSDYTKTSPQQLKPILAAVELKRNLIDLFKNAEREDHSFTQVEEPPNPLKPPLYIQFHNLTYYG